MSRPNSTMATPDRTGCLSTPPPTRQRLQSEAFSLPAKDEKRPAALNDCQSARYNTKLQQQQLQ